MNDIICSTNDLSIRLRQIRLSPKGSGMMGEVEARQITTAAMIRRISVVLVTVFWIIQFAENSLVAFLEEPRTATHFYAPRLLVASIGIIVTWALVETNIRMLGTSFRKRAAVAVLAATVGCLFISTINYSIFRAASPPHDTTFNSSDFAFTMFEWSWFFYSITGAILSFSYSIDVRTRDAQLADLRLVTNEAQMRALRYQLNPHFLFNTLNSIASLISRSNNATAERMVENLSDFLRTSLELDPHEDISLAREIDLQGLYLGIETLRFPHRLRVAIDLPDDLRRAMVPSLITQPLIENALKYSVARSSRPVTLRVSAASRDDTLLIVIADEGGDVPATDVYGTGLGLANVRARLRARFADLQDLRTSIMPSGGFVVTIEMPLRLAA